MGEAGWTCGVWSTSEDRVSGCGSYCVLCRIVVYREE